jgi:ABC-2 type transport system permease protein
MAGASSTTLEDLIRAVFYNAHFLLLFIIPAITMSSFAEEKKNESFKLLQSAPLTAIQIVLGKFLAVAGVMGLVLLGTAVYPLFLMKFGDPDVGVILSSYLGMFLLTCSWLALGLWISSLVSNVFLAFTFTMLGLFLLMVLNWLSESIASGTGVESFLKYIASTDHLDVFFKGMLSVSDVTYFACFIALFLFFTNFVLDSQRWR